MLIGTHSGVFHCDEAFACYLLHNTDKFKNASIIRTRNPDEIKKADVVVDVGGVYDVSANRFDHHQKGFTTTFNEESSIKLSSAGLIYKHFGKEVLKNLLKCTDEEILDILWKKLYHSFVKPIDAIDNGIEQYPTKIEPLYTIKSDISSRISYLNPPWNKATTDAERDELFRNAMACVGAEFKLRADFYFNTWLPGKEIVEEALKTRFDVHKSGKIIKLKEFCSWKSLLFDFKEQNDVLFVIYPSFGQWRVNAVPLRLNSFESKNPLKKKWRGLRDQKLSTLSGIEGCTFVHSSGFTGGCSSFEGVLKMAVDSIVEETSETKKVRID